MDRPTLTGELIVLRPIDRQDVDALWEVVSDPEGQRLVGLTRPQTREDLVARVAASGTGDDRIELAVRTSAADECLGETTLHDIDPVLASAWLSLAMRPAYRSRGYGTEAVGLMLGLAFDGLGLHRVGLRIPAVNARAQSMHENLGFRVEGRLRDAYRDGDGWCDAVLMGMLADEYRAGQPV